MGALIYGLRRQRQVLSAVIYREAVVRFSGRSLGLLEEVGTIVVHVAMFSALRIFAGVEMQDGMPVLPFICIGVYNFWIFRTGVFLIPSAITSIKSYQAYPQVSPLDLALARGAVNILLYIFIAIATFLLLELFGYSPAVGSWSGVLLALIGSGIYGIGCGLVMAGIFHYLPIVRTVFMIVIIRGLALLAGTFFVYSDLPPNLRVYAKWIPNLQLNDIARAAYFPSFRENWTSLTYIFSWIGGSLLIGCLVERALRSVTINKKNHL
ncbi:ABC transporter permease [Novacetimonas hansenii]|uniref:ABC transporter permease n=1 Tax=Novacetimonas hansenii TaxID=436 RepID=A0AAW5ELY2_NOVHA|nr:hypothetical protein [Novacetimonas hansenii]MCJ8352831.1 hypothetical protein [Novacetimonas hansenii]